jgi:hypothetical protein
VELRDPGSDLSDRTDSLVSEDAARDTRRNVTFEDVEVGAADRCLSHFDDRVGRGRDARHRPFENRALAGSLIHERFHRLRQSGYSSRRVLYKSSHGYTFLF